LVFDLPARLVQQRMAAVDDDSLPLLLVVEIQRGVFSASGAAYRG